MRLNRHKLYILYTSCLLIFILYPSHSYAANFMKYFTFSEKGVLKLWKEKISVGRVNYKILNDKKGKFVRADSNKSASGLYYEIKYNPKNRPYISWKWRVDKFPTKDPDDMDSVKEDFAARVYVIFPAKIFIFSRCLEYVWDDVLKKGTVTSSPLSNRIRLFVLQSGKRKGWVQEERNIYKDYLEAFGEEPEDFDDEVGAIAFMSDTDDTQSSARANIDELRIGYAKPLFGK